MIGIFDSGIGGLTALARLRILKPCSDICYLADKENAPYGEKDAETLVKLVKRNIDRLRYFGCGEILAACCTASAIFDKLPSEYQRQVTPIIRPAAKEALRLSPSGRIGVIATAATVGMDAFGREIRLINPEAKVFSGAAQPLVALVENGERDGAVSINCEDYLKNLLSPFAEAEVETLILGCTHFTHLTETIERILKIKTVSPSFVGAEIIAEKDFGGGSGKTVYI